MGKKLYVGNLTYGVTDSDLQQMFAAHGTVQSAQVIMDRDTGRSKGFGFVEMGSDQEAQAAITALNGKEVDGRALTVNEARPKTEGGGGGAAAAAVAAATAAAAAAVAAVTAAAVVAVVADAKAPRSHYASQNTERVGPIGPALFSSLSAEFRSGNYTAAEEALLAAVQAAPDNRHVTGTAAFYRAMSLFLGNAPRSAAIS